MNEKDLRFKYLNISFFLAILVCVAPASDFFNFDLKRGAELFLILITLITFSISIPARNTIFEWFFVNRVELYLLLVIILLGLLSSFACLQPDKGVIEVITFASIFLIIIYCAVLWSDVVRVIPLLISGVLVSIAIQEVKFFSYYFAFLASGREFSFMDFFFSFNHPRYYNQYQIWLLPILSLVLLSDNVYLEKKSIKILIWVVSISWWCMSFTTHGRGAVLSIIGSFFIVYLIYREQAKRYLLNVLLLFVLGFLMYQLLFYWIPYIISEPQNSDFSESYVVSKEALIAKSIEIRTSSSGRLTHIWPRAINLFLENLWLGVGPMQYSAWNGSQTVAHPHNSVLQIASEWGVIALLLIGYLFYRWVSRWIKRFNYLTLKEEGDKFKLIVISLTFSLSSAAIYSLFSGVIVMPMSQLTGMMVISMAVAVYHIKSAEVEVHAPCSGFYNTMCIMIFSSIAIIYFWLVSSELVPRVFVPKFIPEHISFMGPRFWSN